MPTDQRRAAGRRRAWGRGPIILRFEPLEGRQLLSTTTAATPKPDLVGAAFDTAHNLDRGDSFHARGEVLNRGNAPVSVPFRVGIYASTTPGLSASSVLLGEATIPAGLQPGEKAAFDQVVSLPADPMSGVAPSGTIYVATLVDPEGAVSQSDTHNDSGTGQGYDVSMVTLTPHKPAALVGASLGAYPDQAQWGGTVKVTAQVNNAADGDAPPTRARVVLTPSGAAPGGAADVTVGSLNVPALGAWQTASVSQDVKLPASPPSPLAGSTRFTLSVVPDADFLTNPLSPHVAGRGIGYDMTPLAIAAPTDLGAANGPKPDLTPTAVRVPTLGVGFNQNFQVTTHIQNQGNLDSGEYTVRFLLVGTDGNTNGSLFLGDARLNGLKAGFGQDVVQTLRLPDRLPNGLTLNAGSAARIAVEVDPEHTLDEASKANNVFVSDVVTLKVVGTDGTTTPVAAPASAATTTTTTTAAGKAMNSRAVGKTTTDTTKSTTGSRKGSKPATASHTLQHNLKVFPRRVSDYVKGRFKKR